jgi:hypothetical protein
MWDAVTGTWVDDEEAIFINNVDTICATLEMKRESLTKRLSLALFVDGESEATLKATLVQEWSDACAVYETALSALLGE